MDNALEDAALRALHKRPGKTGLYCPRCSKSYCVPSIHSKLRLEKSSIHRCWHIHLTGVHHLDIENG